MSIFIALDVEKKTTTLGSPERVEAKKLEQAEQKLRRLNAELIAQNEILNRHNPIVLAAQQVLARITPTLLLEKKQQAETARTLRAQVVKDVRANLRLERGLEHIISDLTKKLDCYESGADISYAAHMAVKLACKYPAKDEKVFLKNMEAIADAIASAKSDIKYFSHLATQQDSMIERWLMPTLSSITAIKPLIESWHDAPWSSRATRATHQTKLENARQSLDALTAGQQTLNAKNELYDIGIKINAALRASRKASVQYRETHQAFNALQSEYDDAQIALRKSQPLHDKAAQDIARLKDEKRITESGIYTLRERVFLENNLTGAPNLRMAVDAAHATFKAFEELRSLWNIYLGQAIKFDDDDIHHSNFFVNPFSMGFSNSDEFSYPQSLTIRDDSMELDGEVDDNAIVITLRNAKKTQGDKPLLIACDKKNAKRINALAAEHGITYYKIFVPNMMHGIKKWLANTYPIDVPVTAFNDAMVRITRSQRQKDFWNGFSYTELMHKFSRIPVHTPAVRAPCAPAREASGPSAPSLAA